MDDSRINLDSAIRTEIVDKLLTEDHMYTVSVVSKTNTEEEKEELKQRAFDLEQELEDIREIQEDLINFVLKDKDCPCFTKRIFG